LQQRQLNFSEVRPQTGLNVEPPLEDSSDIAGATTIFGRRRGQGIQRRPRNAVANLGIRNPDEEPYHAHRANIRRLRNLQQSTVENEPQASEDDDE
jgi:hypothetical protein